MRLSRVTGLCLLLAVTGLLSCSHGQLPELSRKQWESAPGWPAKGPEARVVHVGAITSSNEIVASRGFFNWLGRAVLGARIPETLQRPAGVAVDLRGRIAVADPGGSAVLLFDTHSGKTRRIEKVGKLALISPMGVAFDRQGRLLVTDSRLGLLARIDLEGNAVEIRRDFERPTGVAVHPKTEAVYVVETLAHQVLVLDPTLKPIRHFGSRGEGQGELNFPTFIAFDPDGACWVVDAMNGRVQQFDANGAFLSSVGQAGDAAGSFAHPKGIAFDAAANLYVVDALFGNVQIFDREGQLLLHFARSGKGEADLDLPMGIAIDGLGRIFLADSGNHRIQILRTVESRSP